MLIKCPECNREISSAAACCPGCGYPINTPPKPKKQSKKKGGGSKLPNGYGSVYKLSGNRRKPWVAAKTFGWILDEEKGTAKQVQRPIGYFPTKSEALDALANYNENPYDIDVHNITFEEVYNKWSAEYFPTLKSKSSARTVIAAYKYCKSCLEICPNVSCDIPTSTRIASSFSNLYLTRFTVKFPLL